MTDHHRTEEEWMDELEERLGRVERLLAELLVEVKEKRGRKAQS